MEGGDLSASWCLDGPLREPTLEGVQGWALASRPKETPSRGAALSLPCPRFGMCRSW